MMGFLEPSPPVTLFVIIPFRGGSPGRAQEGLASLEPQGLLPVRVDESAGSLLSKGQAPSQECSPMLISLQLPPDCV